MATTVLLDELHLTIRGPGDWLEPATAAVRRTLAGVAFTDRLLAAVREVVQSFPELAAVQISIAR